MDPVATLTIQIDIAATVLGLLGFSDESTQFGYDRKSSLQTSEPLDPEKLKDAIVFFIAIFESKECSMRFVR